MVQTECNDRGSAVIEASIMLMVVMMLAFGYIMFTQAIRTQTVLQMAAREGARAFAITDRSLSAVNKAKQELALGGVNPDRAVITPKANGYERLLTVELPSYGFHVPFAGEYRFGLKAGAAYKLEANPDF